MPNISVDHRAALLVLERAVKESMATGFHPSSRLKEAISSIMGGTHLTYKYLLATGLLAKATNSEVNPLVLQAGADASGAYDARSLCHKVIVPHENRLLKDGLGGSNEPFLNKPARFTMIGLKNAVRAGNDKRTLIALHQTLSSVKSKRDSYCALRDLVYFARTQRATQEIQLSKSLAGAAGGREKISAFLARLISSSVHGETSVLATAAVLWILGQSRGQDWSIQVHPVNESGASSNEISDIDVRLEDELIVSAEVKDKTYKMHDVEHALQKVSRAGFHTLHFIGGPRARLSGDDENLKQFAYDCGVELYMIDLSSLIANTVAFAPSSLRLEAVAERVLAYAAEARVKTETMRWITESLRAIHRDG